MITDIKVTATRHGKDETLVLTFTNANEAWNAYATLSGKDGMRCTYPTPCIKTYAKGDKAIEAALDFFHA